MNSRIVRTAKISGISLLLMALLAGVGYGYAFTSLKEAGTAQPAAETANLVLLFLGTFWTILALDLFLSYSLYRVISLKNSMANVLAAAFRLLYSLLLAWALWAFFHKDMPLQSQLALFEKRWSLSLVVFGLHLILLGLALVKSELLPAWLGYLCVLAGIFYSFHHGLALASAAYTQHKAFMDMLLSPVMAAAELVLAFFLLFFNRRLRKPLSNAA